jgi:hypothetical protein
MPNCPELSCKLSSLYLAALLSEAGRTILNPSVAVAASDVSRLPAPFSVAIASDLVFAIPPDFIW